jgi:hypothetical protein
VRTALVISSKGVAGAAPLSCAWFVLLLAACGVSTKPHNTGAGQAGAVGTTGAGGSIAGAAGATTTGTAGAGSAGATGTAGAGASGSGGSTGGVDASATGTGGAGTQADAATDTTPLSGITVNIGGTVVPKEKVLLFIHVGHSNMAGRATDPASLHDFNYTTAPRLWSYAKGGVWKPAVEPLSPDGMTLGKAGPGMSILRAALAVAPPDFYIVSVGHGETGDDGGYCRNFRKGGLFYDNAMDSAMELKGKVTFGAIWMMFGTSEFGDMTHVTTFGQCLTGVVTDMRTDLGMPNLPVLIGDWEAGATDKFLPTTAFAVSVIAQIHSTVTAVPPAALIPTDGLAMQDPDADGQGGIHHFNFAGHQGWGMRGIGLLMSSGWAPWAAP